MHNDVGIGVFFPLFCKKQEKKHWLFFIASENYNSESFSQSLSFQLGLRGPAGVSPEQALPFLGFCLGDFTFLLGQPRAFKSSSSWCSGLSTVLPTA